MDRQWLGRIGEDAAVRYLEARGYRIVARNFRCPLGEIDLVAEQGGVTVFVEVKTRRSVACGAPVEAITPRKRRRIALLAAYYLQGARRPDAPARFDAVAVTVTPQGRVGRVDLVVDAFAVG
ncbi:MAG: YraN family protein [Armatimonadota bacterium]|nr:YraN family protein [Armatimonadota bacterium]